MNKNKDDINKLLEDLKTEIKKIDLLCKQKSQLSEIKTYRISCPQITNKNSNKKIITKKAPRKNPGRFKILQQENTNHFCYWHDVFCLAQMHEEQH